MSLPLTIQLPLTEEEISPHKDTSQNVLGYNGGTHETPYLPPEIVELIVSFILVEIPRYNYDDTDKNIDDYEYTLLNILIVFPYLVKQITPQFDYGAIPKHIYNFVYMKIDNVYDIFVMLFENLKAARNDLDMWLEFITCEHSPFYNTDEGIRFIYYILSKYSNHQQKKMKKKLLCNLLNHEDVFPIPKSLDNIIYNILLYNYKNTKKLQLSLLTSKEKQLLLNYTVIKGISRYRYTIDDYDISKFIISVFKLYSTKIINILIENTHFNNIHILNKDSLFDYILNNYTADNYLLDSFIKYYLSAVLKHYYSSLSYSSHKVDFTQVYYDIIAPILEKAIFNKHTDLISLLLNLDETTKTRILFIIGYDSTYKDKVYLDLAIEYIINVYYKSTFNFNDLSLFNWFYDNINYNQMLNLNINKTLLSKLFLYKMAEANQTKTDHIHIHDSVLLYKIYNYTVFNFYRLNINLIYNKTYSFKDKRDGTRDEARDGTRDDSITTLFSYSSSITDTLELLQLKNDIDNMYNYIIKFYNLIVKCTSIIKLAQKETSVSDESDDSKLGIDKTYTKKYHKRLLYIYNVYNYILKHKLYYETSLKTTMQRASLKHIEQINSSKFNIDLKTIGSNTRYKDTSKNRKIIENILKLKVFITKMVEIINKD